MGGGGNIAWMSWALNKSEVRGEAEWGEGWARGEENNIRIRVGKVEVAFGCFR